MHSVLQRVFTADQSSLRDQRLSGTKTHGANPSGQSETIPQKPTCACGYIEVLGCNALTSAEPG